MLLSTIAVVWSFNQSTAAGKRAINTQVGILLTITAVVKDSIQLFGQPGLSFSQ